VTTLGFDGNYGLQGPAQRVIVALAIIAGLIFTTMPITIIGEAFRAAWQRKELVEVQMRIQAMLIQRGLTVHQLHMIFSEFDTSGDSQLDWGEFKRAMKKLGLKVPVSKLRSLFAQFDEDETGEVDYHEFCRILFPNMDEDASALVTQPGEASCERSGSEQSSDDKSNAGGIPPPRKNRSFKADLKKVQMANSAVNAFTLPSMKNPACEQDAASANFKAHRAPPAPAFSSAAAMVGSRLRIAEPAVEEGSNAAPNCGATDQVERSAEAGPDPEAEAEAGAGAGAEAGAEARRETLPK
jgi:hypothetical protein